MSSVTFKNVNKVYSGDTHIVKDINLEIASGEFVVPEFNCEVRHSSISSSQCHFFKYNRWLLEA
ncbi:hypothetical protein [Vibrio diazotrophicus]|uniref:hypothetical protein n=1 Tax=Vibrio diazotrophicus TaxID=685 RepID=UPI0011BEAB96|nr:hypothetical protein [Vibrio diazotrophicus]